MELVKLEGVHFTYPKRSRADTAGPSSGGSGELDEEGDVEETAEEQLESVPRRSSLGPIHALRGVDLTFSAGESVALLGHAGSGRSTLLEIIAGTLRPSQGSAWLRGWATGLIAAGAGFFPDATVRDNVIRNGLLCGAGKQQMARLAPQIIEFAGLTASTDERLRTVTRPESRRLANAVPLHLSPAVFLADDPAVFGTAEQREQTLSKLEEKRGPDRALILVVNRPEIVKRLAQRVVVLSAGQVVFDGATLDGLRYFRRPSTLPPVEEAE